MYIYIFLFAFILVAYLYSAKYGNHIPLLYKIIVIILWFISAFRAEHIGSDHYGYNQYFVQIGRTGDAYFAEKGYVLLNKLLYEISTNPIILSIVVTSLLVFSYAYYTKQNIPKQYWILALLVFVFQPYFYIQSTFNIMRQGCATAFVILAIPFLLQNKWLKYSLLITIAATFHYSAILFLSLLIIKKIYFNHKMIVIIAVISLLLNFLGAFSILFNILEKYRGLENKEESVLNLKPYVLFIFSTVIYLTQKYYKLFTNSREKFFVDIFLLSLCLLIIAVQNDALYRMYITFALISVPGIITICKNLSKQNSLIEYAFVGYYSCFFLGYIMLWYFSNNYQYYPFEFAF